MQAGKRTLLLAAGIALGMMVGNLSYADRDHSQESAAQGKAAAQIEERQFYSRER